jgi:hypothetical protein
VILVRNGAALNLCHRAFSMRGFGFAERVYDEGARVMFLASGFGGDEVKINSPASLVATISRSLP